MRQRNGERMKNNKPLTPKQRERLAREARQKNAAKAAAAAAVKEKIPFPCETKWFIALLALLLVFATLASVLFGFLVVEWTENPYATVYETVRMKDYLDTSKMGKKFYTGLDVNVASAYSAYLEKVNKLEETLEENLRLCSSPTVRRSPLARRIRPLTTAMTFPITLSA